MHLIWRNRDDIILIIGTTAVCVLLFGDFGKPASLIVAGILDFCHVPMFALIAAMVLWWMGGGRWAGLKAGIYVECFLLILIFAILSETIQHFLPDRSFQLGDIASDMEGSSIFLMCAYLYKRNLPSKKRLLITVVVITVAVASSLPLACTAAEEARAKKDFPLLASFETRTEMTRWSVEEGRTSISGLHATHGTHSLKVRLMPGLYPGIAMNHPLGNWRGYEVLEMDLFVEGGRPLPVTVRINDARHNEAYEDRYNRTFTLEPGPNHLKISLQEVERAPRGRLMDMGRISMICIFSYKLKEARTAYFDNMRLGPVH